MTMTTDQTVSESTVKKTISVKAPKEVAWRVFAERMSTWWPLATHKLGKGPAKEVVLEPRAGGRWYERGEDGSTCDWGHVLAWEPTDRLVLSWEISASWQSDPSIKTEVEVRFFAEGAAVTRVELEHRKLDAYGAETGVMRGQFDSPGGWPGLLEAFAARAAAD